MIDTIAVISGKGGTGKSSLTRAFFELQNGAYAADCDVDGANLFIGIDHTVIDSEDFIAGFDYSINPDLCTQCGRCVELCRFNAIDNFTINSFLCEGCNVCYYACPVDAVNKIDKKCGVIHHAKSTTGSFVYGRLGTGEENSGKMVTRVRELAKAGAEASGASLLILDGPPGVGCPVIAAVTATTGVVIVTEPTCSGISDMKRAVELVLRMHIKISIVINRSDINTDLCNQIERYVLEKGLFFAGRIGYSPLFNKAQRNRCAVTGFTDSSAAREVKDVWSAVCRDLLDNKK
ncbi:MAG: ATP-binding protein [Spirochaetes bacterium]|jgi:MinD superfamily P-loop ATPase|nr:ATP-binding protein [Spirochaetota bacterium]